MEDSTNLCGVDQSKQEREFRQRSEAQRRRRRRERELRERELREREICERELQELRRLRGRNHIDSESAYTSSDDTPVPVLDAAAVLSTRSCVEAAQTEALRTCFHMRRTLFHWTVAEVEQLFAAAEEEALQNGWSTQMASELRLRTSISRFVEVLDQSEALIAAVHGPSSSCIGPA